MEKPMNSIQSHATKIVGAALRHDFGVPLGVMGRNIDFIKEIIDHSEEREIRHEVRLQISSISNRIEEIEAELYVSFNGFGKAIGALEDFKREQEFARLRTQAGPKIEDAISSAVALYAIVKDEINPELKRLAAQILSSSRRLQSMLSGLTHFIRIGAITSDLFVMTNLRDLVVRNTASAQIASFERHRRNRIIEIVGNAMMECIPSHIEQLVQNYVGNAIKYAALSDSPLVQVKLEEEGYRSLVRRFPQQMGKYSGRGDWIVIQVSDNGPGVDPIIEKSAFKLYTFKSHKSISVPSTGVGLAVCQLVTQIHGGFAFFTREAEITSFWAIMPKNFENRLDTHPSR